MAGVAVDDRPADHTAEACLSDWQRNGDWPRSTPGGRGGHRCRPYPFDALVAVLGEHLPPVVVAARLGVNDRQVYRWRGRGLSEEQADGLATRLGVHPAAVWPNWLDDVGEPPDGT